MKPRSGPASCHYTTCLIRPITHRHTHKLPSISDRQDTQLMLWAATYTFRSHTSSVPWLSYLRGFVFPNLSHPPSLFFSPLVYPSINHLSLSLCPPLSSHGCCSLPLLQGAVQKLTVLPLLTYFVRCFAREKVRLFAGDHKRGGLRGVTGWL